ncbi:porin [Aquabacterium sp.]|uniref:porin n=1 Tax=Aquabacterium sp. TaxID=1872578 RepID=UPI0035AF0C3D
MTLQRFAPAALAVACLAVCAGAQAQDSGFRFSGFGTVGLAHTNSHDVEFLTPGQPGDGATSTGFDFSPDTKLGVQTDYKINQMLSATAQVLSKENGKGNWNPSPEWLFVKAQLTPAVSARVGRMGTPFFMISDFRDVNYANLWVRPPLEVYGQVPITNFNGADLTYKTDIGDTTLTGTVFGGPSRSYYETSKVKLNDQFGFNATAELGGDLTFRLGYARSKLTFASSLTPQVSAAYAGLAPYASLVGLSASDLTYFANQLAADDARSSFLGFGATWDVRNWTFSGEFTKRRTDSYIPNTTGWYASAGYRFGKFTPFVYASEVKVDHQPSNPIPTNRTYGGLTTSFLTASAYGTAVLNKANVAQKALAAGVRWDAFKNVAVKGQFEMIKPDSNTGLMYAATPTANVRDKTINVLSLSVDFVF